MKDLKYAVRAMENIARINDVETLRDVRDAVRMRYNALRAEKANVALERHKRETA